MIPNFIKINQPNKKKFLLKRTDVLNSHLEQIIPLQVALLILKVL